MKKQYINPTTYIFEMQVQNQILAGSVKTDTSGKVESVSTSGEFTGGTTLSRQGSIWDDEE